jgi:hypothetical protein
MQFTYSKKSQDGASGDLHQFCTRNKNELKMIVGTSIMNSATLGVLTPRPPSYYQHCCTGSPASPTCVGSAGPDKAHSSISKGEGRLVLSALEDEGDFENLNEASVEDLVNEAVALCSRIQILGVKDHLPIQMTHHKESSSSVDENFVAAALQRYTSMQRIWDDDAMSFVDSVKLTKENDRLGPISSRSPVSPQIHRSVVDLPRGRHLLDSDAIIALKD